jgi:hypothetical protein
MIERELRIGSWIADHDCSPYYFQVEEIYKNHFGYRVSYRNGNIHVMAEHVELIQFTEEIARKSGFVSLNDHWYGLTICGEECEFLWSEHDSYIRWKGNKFLCEFLHQFQNLFFELTGEELKINLS